MAQMENVDSWSVNELCGWIMLLTKKASMQDGDKRQKTLQMARAYHQMVQTKLDGMVNDPFGHRGHPSEEYQSTPADE